MKKTLSLLIILFMFKHLTYSQEANKIDSLENELKRFDMHKKELGGNKITLMDTTKANILYSICEEYWMNSPEKGMAYSKELLELSEQIGFKKGMANAYNSIGVNYFYKGDYANALEKNKEALKISEEAGYKQGIALSYLCIGNVLNSQGNNPEALKNYFAALKINEETGDKKYIAACYNSIGNIYSDQHNYHEALKNYFSTLKIMREIGYKLGIAVAYGNIGNIYSSQGNYPEALKNHFVALTLNKEAGNKDWIATELGNIGFVYYLQGHYTEALRNQFSSLEILEEIGDKGAIVSCYVNIGGSYLKKKKYNEAFQYLNKGLNLSKEIGSLEHIKRSYEGFAELDSATGNFKLALEHYKMFVIFRDSLFNEETTKKLVQSQMQYDFDKKESLTKAEHEKKSALADAEIKRQTLIKNSTLGGVGITGIFSFLLVRASNRKKKTIFDKQVSEVEMKALRSQMNPHFIFNALQSVNDFILKKDTMNASNFLIKFSKLMRSVLENSVHKEVTIEKDLASLELYMQLESSRLDIPFDYEIIIDPKIDPETTFIPPLILQPFVENSIWHGLKHKKEKGKIKIEIKEAENSIICSIEDNGVGREKANALKQLMSEKKESLGMKLTKERLRILEQVKNFRSRMDVIDLKDGLNNPLGLRVELSLPLATLN